MKNGNKGLVMKSTGSWYKIYEESTKKIYKGRLQGKFRIKEMKVTNPIAVGDYVSFNIEKDSCAVIIDSILNRENYIIRRSTHKVAHTHIIAANIDLAILMCTLHTPKTSTGFIDRFLVSASAYGIPVLLLFNKSDTWGEKHRNRQKNLSEMYEAVGYPCMAISSLTDEYFEELMERVLGKKSLIAGHSGVGKSTLINRLAPSIQQQTAAVSSFANKGVHTTTFAEMFLVTSDTFVIDIPGIKELGIANMEKQELGFLFPEFKEYIPNCKFHNCSHTNEPKCAVKQAVEDKSIYLERYKSYLSILYNEDNRR